MSCLYILQAAILLVHTIQSVTDIIRGGSWLIGNISRSYPNTPFFFSLTVKTFVHLSVTCFHYIILCLIKDITEILTSLSLQPPPPQKNVCTSTKKTLKQGGSDHGEILIRLNMVVVYGVQRHIHQYFSYITTVSFIGGGKQSTRRNHPSVASNLVRLIKAVVAVIVW